MNKIFDQAHAFVVFHPGSSGNLISNLLHNIINNTIIDITISSVGHVHENFIAERKIKGIDFLSFGTGFGQKDDFVTLQEKIIFYKQNINNADYNPKLRYVTWTHDFSNISIYNEIFPNAIILVITTNTLRERLISLFMNINKNFFSDARKLTFTEEEQKHVARGTKAIISLMLGKYYKNLIGKTNINYETELLKALMYRFYYDIHQYANYSLDDHVPNVSSKLNYKNGEFILANTQPIVLEENPNIHCLPFADILANSTNVIDTLSRVADKSLTLDEKNYLEKSIKKYIDSQETALLLDPVVYYLNSLRVADKIAADHSAA